MAVPRIDHPLQAADLTIGAGATGLRPVRLADVPILYAQIKGRDEVLRWLCWRGPRDLAHLVDRYDPPLFGAAEGTFGVMLAVVDGDGAPIGECSLTFESDPGACELGYWLGAAHHGLGHGSRLVELAADLCLERLGCRVVTASIKEGNDRSLRALARAGFVADRAPASAAAVDPSDAIAWVATLTARAWRRRRQARPGTATATPDNRPRVSQDPPHTCAPSRRRSSSP